jgi:hypothetical protein
MRIRDPGWRHWIRDPGWKKVGSGIRDKHPGSATLVWTGYGIDSTLQISRIRIRATALPGDSPVQMEDVGYNVCP